MVEKTVWIRGWDEKIAKNGSPYLIFHFDGDENYAVFNAQVAQVLKDSGSAIITLEQKGEFTNLVAAKMVTKADASVQSKIGEQVGIEIPIAHGNDREKTIKKQVALKAAVELVKGGVATFGTDFDLASKETLKLADKFLKWLDAE